jgi:cytochrome c peroxidase
VVADRSNEVNPLVPIVRQLAVQRKIGPLARPPAVRPALSRLGQALAFDKILSGNRDISCMSCHLPAFATGDDRSLAIGQGATGLVPARVHPAGAFIPRNSPSLFNLTALQSLFWDRRVTVDAPGRFHTPAGEALSAEMTRVFEFGPVSALPLFPVLSREEMRAQSGNELAAIPDAEIRAIWGALMRRLGATFRVSPPVRGSLPRHSVRRDDVRARRERDRGISDRPIHFHRYPVGPVSRRRRSRTEPRAARRRADVPVDSVLALPQRSGVHRQPIPQRRAGAVRAREGNGSTGRDDFGRMNVTGSAGDQYRFRTTPLRNIELTGPYGHDGAFASLRGFIDHYSQSDLKLRVFDPGSLEPLLRATLVPNIEDVLATRDTILTGVVLPPSTIDQLTGFMSALTDPRARHLDRSVPGRVPSGLPIDRLP